MDLKVKILSATERKKYSGWIVDNNLSAKRRWPYLYDGDAVETERVIRSYLPDDGCIVAMAFDGDKPIGVEMSNRLEHLPLPITDDMRRWIADNNSTVEKTYWANWIIIDPVYRGLDVGRRLIEASMAALRKRGAELWVFNVLMRRPGHPAQPKGWRSDLDYFEYVGFRRAMLPPTPSDWADLEPSGSPVTRKFYMPYYLDLRG